MTETRRARIVVFHSSYGCDTGCCGHVVEMESPDGSAERSFAFSHPYDEDALEFAKELVRETFGEEHVADLDWDRCIVSED